jgi:hypothetical protein
VPRRHLAEAVTLSATAGRTSALVGPALGGLAIALWGEAAPFLLNAASFLVLMFALVLMTAVAPIARTLGTTFRGELVEGLRHIVGTPVLSGLFMMELVFGLFSMNPVMITIYGRDVLGVGPEGLGGLLAAPAVGSLVGIATLLVVGQARWPGRFVIACTFVYCGALVGFAFTSIYVVAFGILALTGLMDALISVTRNSIVQLAAPPDMRGRVMANMGTVTRGVSPLAQTQSGLLSGLVGPSFALVFAASVLAINAGLTARFNLTLRSFSMQDALDSPASAGDVSSIPPEAPVA